MFLSRLAGAATLPLPELNADSELATAGYYRLEWRLPSLTVAERYELQESRDSGFREATTLYRGADLATVLSGRADGVRYYRVRALRQDQYGPWSATLQVETRHHSLGRALGFFAAGALVFLLTLLLILRGPRTPEAARHG